jgi:hypothetical protein
MNECNKAINQVITWNDWLGECILPCSVVRNALLNGIGRRLSVVKNGCIKAPVTQTTSRRAVVGVKLLHVKNLKCATG